MKNAFLISSAISVIFIIVKFIEMRFVTKQDTPVKLLVRDTLFVLFSSLVGFFIMDQLEPLIKKTMKSGGGGGGDASAAPPVFVGEPNF